MSRKPSSRVLSRSLRWRLPALMCALFLVLLAAVLYTAYREVESALLSSGSDRARHASGQIAELFRRSAAQTLDQVQRTAAVPALRDYLREPSADRLASARAALSSRAPAGSEREITVWSATGTRLFEIAGAGSAPTAAPSFDAVLPADGSGRLQAADGRIFSDVAVPINDEASPDGRVTRLGTLSDRSRLRVSTPESLNRLVGRDARIALGNRAGDVWTDFVSIGGRPPISLDTDGIREYRAADGERRIGALTGIPATPWVVWVEFSRAAFTAEAQVFLRRMTTLGLLVAAATALAVWWLAKRFTVPLTDMTMAAEAIALGDYSRQVAAERTDEIGRLGRAFNAMTTKVADAHHDLQERVDERTRELHTALNALAQQNREREAYLATLVDSSGDASWGGTCRAS